MSGGQSPPPNQQTNNESDGESSGSNPMPAPRHAAGHGPGLHFGTSGSSKPDLGLNFGASGSAIPDPGLNFGASSSAVPDLNLGASGSAIPGSGLNLGASGSAIPDPGLHLGASGSATPDLGLYLGALSSRACPSGVRPPVQPPHQINIWPHLQARVRMPQLPPQVRPRALSLPPHPQAEIMDKNKWKCAVCGIRFYNMRAVSGHMKVHKDRGWRGINPPPEFRRPLQGIHIRENYPSQVSSNNLRIGGNESCNLELGLGLTRPVFPRLNFDYDAIAAARNEKERDERVLGKRPAPPELGGNSGADNKSKRPVDRGVLDINKSPPSDKSDEGPSDKPDEGAAGGSMQHDG